MKIDKQNLKTAAFNGLVNNPVFVLVLGMCPTIAQSTTIANAVGLGLATAFVLVFSNVFISLLRKVIPDKVRLPAYIVIIATFVTLVQMFITSFLPALNESIGAFIPLIVVNCIILGRAEAFASKNDVLSSAVDGLSMGLGFVLSITLLGAVRQALTLAGLEIFSKTAGGFITLGLLMALFNAGMSLYKEMRAKRALYKEAKA
ncbi:MAG: electron transport complex subunit RsxE [Clostridia bacterium]|jgi:electron transport complex protein RnfE|nr:electron transport complex subunit RsxE [Clostridia bacterium]